MIPRFSKIIIIAAVLVLAGVVYLIFSNPFAKEPPSTPDTTLTKPPPRESVSPPEPSAPSFEEKVTDFKQAVTAVTATGESQEVTLVFTEAEVNDQATKLLTQVEIPEDIPLEVNSVSIDLQPDNNLLTEAETTILGLGVTLKAGSQVSIRDGKLEVTITDVSFGSIPLPGVVKDKIVAFITQKTDDLLVQLTEATIGADGIDLEFKEVNTQEDKVTITVLIKKAA